MLRIMCKSKISRAKITKKELHYSGSIGIDKSLLEVSNMLPNEMVQVLNLNNGARFNTYIVEEPKGSGTIALYGPATYKGEIGDKVIIISYCMVEEKETRSITPKFITADEENRAVKKKHNK
ncbi:MAG: aspartate 1-decarboxylase [Candidatus Omnitrophica bacterium]|nr:aspartate 1-decarboxylase [Candidatus Omnitrophota bacterium]